MKTILNKIKVEGLILLDIKTVKPSIIKTVWNFCKNKDIKRLQNICQFAVHTRKLGDKRHMYLINGTGQTD